MYNKVDLDEFYRRNKARKRVYKLCTWQKLGKDNGCETNRKQTSPGSPGLLVVTHLNRKKDKLRSILALSRKM